MTSPRSLRLHLAQLGLPPRSVAVITIMDRVALMPKEQHLLRFGLTTLREGDVLSARITNDDSFTGYLCHAV